MTNFSKIDKKAIHILITYMAEYIRDKESNKHININSRDSYRYKFVWSDIYNTTISFNVMTSTFIVPRFLSPKLSNTRLESILKFGPKIFETIINNNERNDHPFTYLLSKIKSLYNKNNDKYCLNELFRILQYANHQLLLAYKNYPNKPVDWSKIDDIFVKCQSHIFLISALFELYNPLTKLP